MQRLGDSTVNPETKVCTTCKNLQNLFGDKIYLSRSEVETSAGLGCHYCSFVVNASTYFDLWNRMDEDDRVILMWPGSIVLQLWIGDIHLYWQFYTPAGYPPAWPGIPQDSNSLDVAVGGSPQSVESYEFIRSRLQECEANHFECKFPPRLPTRLLDMLHKDAKQIRLIETESLPAGHTATYIALSYCWGKGQSVMLRSENLEAMKLGLTVSSLPQTLQDAVTVTRALGQKYLWIDALCIIQDSPTDWEVESSRMGLVYRGAYLTIAAATASDVSDGFLSRNYRETVPWYRVPYHEEWVNHEACSTILGARLVKSGFTCDDKEAASASLLAWKSRGWTLQEQLLSRRILKYHAYELLWVCQNETMCQCSLGLEASSSDRLDQPILSYKRWETPNKQWYDVVEDYTARKLTDPRDKLPAISGLAKLFQEVIQSPYIAGMWVKYLLWDLLWVVRSRKVGYALENYIAPSFSWASISSPVEALLNLSPWGGEWVPRTAIEDTGSVVDGKDPLGRVNNGWIKLRGYIFKAALVGEDALTTKYTGRKNFHNDTWLEDFETTNEHGNVEVSVRRFRRPSSITPQDNESSPPRIQHGPVVYLFLVGYQIGDMSITRLKFYFLVLGLSSDKLGMYERLV